MRRGCESLLCSGGRSDGDALPNTDVNTGVDLMDLPGVLGLVPDHHETTNLHRALAINSNSVQFVMSFPDLFKGSANDQRDFCSEGSHRDNSLYYLTLILPESLFFSLHSRVVSITQG